MILGLGTDIVEIDRIKKACECNENFLNKLFTEKELEYIKERNFSYETIAGSFAAKEAISKALGTGFRGFSFKDLEILRDKLKKPYVVLHNNAKNIANKKGSIGFKVSISHSKENAIAVAIWDNGVLDNEKNVNIECNYEAHIRDLIPIRHEYGHKGTYGRCLIIAGSKGFTGAAYLSTKAAINTGAGLVTLGCYKEIWDIMSIKLNEAMTLDNQSCDFFNIMKKADSIAIGPGLGITLTTKSLLHKVLKNSKCNLVIDADALNILSEDLEMLCLGKNRTVITPHPGEMSRLTGYDIEYINNNREYVAVEFSKKYNVVVLLKGHNTVITNGEKTYINPTGNSSMASGGMGDALTGIIAAFMAQGLNPISSALIGAYIHGLIGDKLNKEMYCVPASTLIEKIPFILKELIE